MQITFAADLQVWGASWSGDASEPTAMVAEQGHAYSIHMWDRTAEDLLGSFIDDGSGWRGVPQRWALPWLTEWLMRSAVSESVATERKRVTP